jgi:5-methylcytosine-specific restriction endonuclease McrA
MFSDSFGAGHRYEYPRVALTTGGMNNRLGVAMADHICQWVGCPAEVEPRAGDTGRFKKWCPAHRRAVLLESRAKYRDSLSSTCSSISCSRPVRALSVCHMHYKQILRSEGRIKEQPWNDRRRNNYHVRRERKSGGVGQGSALMADVIAQTGTDCGICGTPVDLALVWPHPSSKSIDHILALARGGSHSLENCQLAHLRCNTSKGAKVA